MPAEVSPEDRAAPERKTNHRVNHRVLRWVIGIVVAIALLIAAGVALLNTSFGQRFVTDQISNLELESGLEIAIGRIEGDLYGQSVLHDVTLSDPKGVFLTIPRAELDWRPFAYLRNVVDIRSLAARRGTLLRLPELNESEEDGPLLPGFDIRIDRFEIDQLMLAEGVAGEARQRVDLLGKAKVSAGQVMLQANGKLGQRDILLVDLDARPDDDLFDLAFDYRAPEGGVLANMLGADASYRAIIAGEGKWSNWDGALTVDRADQRVAAFKLSNKSGRLGMVGQAFPASVTSGFTQDVLGNAVSLAIFGTVEERVIDADVAVRAAAFKLDGSGIVDLAQNRFEDFDLLAQLSRPDLFGPNLQLEGTRLSATLNGPFAQSEIEHSLIAQRIVAGSTVLEGVAHSGTLSRDGGVWRLPLDMTVVDVTTGNALIDPELVNGALTGEVVLNGNRLSSQDLALRFPSAKADLALQGDLARSQYQLTGPVSINGLQLDNVGRTSGTARIALRLDGDNPWVLRSDIDATIAPVSNATLANLAGERIVIRGGVGIGANAPLTFRDLRVDAAKLDMVLNGRVDDGTTTVAGRGTHTQYGDFTVEARLADSGPEATLVLASPLPAAGLRDVRVTLAPTEDGFAIDTNGQSLLGEFNGSFGLVAPANGPTQIAVQDFKVWKTDITGNLTLGDGGADGVLALSGGGLNGSIALSPSALGQSVDLSVRARNASFGGVTPITLARADIQAEGVIGESTNFQGNVLAEGLSYGRLFIGRLAATGELQDGVGDVTASLSGRRGSRFALQLNAGIRPDRIDVATRGEFGGQRIRMPRRAVLAKNENGDWQLQRSQISYGDGAVVAEGTFGGPGEQNIRLGLSGMPLSLADIVFSDIGLGGTVSGRIDYRLAEDGLPRADIRVMIDDLTRSGLVLTSSPIDVALVADLTANRLVSRAVLKEGGERKGRLQARINNLPNGGTVVERLRAGNLFAQFRYSGKAAALWRLAAIDAFDITGPVELAADIRGTLANPRVRGSVGSDNLRVRSGLSGTDVQNVSMSGRFAGSRLQITRFSGTTDNDGRITGSGTVDLEGLGERVEGRSLEIRGPKLDLRANAQRARLLNANGLNATISGPLRIVSSGLGGTIAGRVRIDRASWSLGSAADDAELPRIATREINVRADIAPTVAPSRPWRYLIDAQGSSRIDVDGLGLDSEWGADIILRGTTDDPRIGGEARVVRGAYSFAGTRFELTRGRIDFNDQAPIDPQLDIVAETDRDGLSVTVSVQGSAQQPEINFNSVPALPQEEILSRLLFGGSITSLSATDALQLGTALASLRGGGGGLDPINQLRTAIGLDRLRIVGADPALDRGTGVALGKNIGRRFYVEIITDGRGYSATELEFRVTSWLSLLASISTIGRESAVAEISRDY